MCNAYASFFWCFILEGRQWHRAHAGYVMLILSMAFIFEPMDPMNMNLNESMNLWSIESSIIMYVYYTYIIYHIHILISYNILIPTPVHMWAVTGTSEAWVLLVQLFHSSGNQLFTPTRWTQVAPALRYWATGLCFHSILKESYLHIDALQAGWFTWYVHFCFFT